MTMDLTRRGLFGGTLAAALMPSLAAADTAPVLLITGQSIGHLWTASPALAAFNARLHLTGDPRTFTQLNVALNSSAMNRSYVRADLPNCYWWDDINNRLGPVALKAADTIRRAPIKPIALYHAQGESDAIDYQGSTAEEDDAFVSLFALSTFRVLTALRRVVNPVNPLAVPVFIRRLGALSTGWEATRGMALVRKAQARLVDRQNQNIYWGFRPDASLPLRDGVHPTAASMILDGQETAEMMRGRI